MNNAVEIFIYHDFENKMLIVNYEMKKYKVINDNDLINIFRTNTKVIYVNYLTYDDVISYIDKLQVNNYKRVI